MRTSSQPAGLPFRPWAYLGLVTVPLALAGIATWYAVNDVYLFGDIDWYAAAVPRLLSDGPLYDPAKLGPHPLTPPAYFNQAPSTALFGLVLWLPGGYWIWGAAMVLSVIAGMVLVWPRVGPGGTVLLAPVLLLWLPVTSALGWGNVNALVFFLLALAWRYRRAAGVAIGIAAAVKLVPILGVAWLLGKRDWRGAAVGIAIPALATLTVVAWKGPDTITDFLQLRASEWHPPQSARWDIVELLGLPEVTVFAAAAVLAALAWWRASFSLAVLAMLAGIPALHSHYLTWLLIPLFGAWLPWLLARREGTRVRAMQSAPS